VIRVGLDTNILAYLAGVDRGPHDRDRIDQSRTLMIQMAGRAEVCIATQAAAELFVVLTRAGASRPEARDIVSDMTNGLERIGATPETLDRALDLSVTRQLQLWDALILTSYADAGCTLMLSEDLQHGQTVGSVTVVNPFKEPLHEMLTAVLRP
jgi:predicted nucleic acid-binding protein